jgi:hypothetical protein
MSYSTNDREAFRRVAFYVDKILKGAKPAELPVEQLIKFELVINLKTAKQIRLTIPQNVLAASGQGDQVSSRRRRVRSWVIASSPTNIQPVLNVVAENAARVCEASDADIVMMVGSALIRIAGNYGSSAGSLVGTESL